MKTAINRDRRAVTLQYATALVKHRREQTLQQLLSRIRSEAICAQAGILPNPLYQAWIHGRMLWRVLMFMTTSSKASIRVDTYLSGSWVHSKEPVQSIYAYHD